jgi:hypothetical protein
MPYKDPEKAKARCKQYYLEHKQTVDAYKKKWAKDNHEKVSNYQKNYRESHVEEQKLRVKACRKAKPEKYKAYHKEYQKGYYPQYQRNRRKTDPYFRLVGNLRNRVKSALKGLSKTKSTQELLGAPFEVVRDHIENQFKIGMTWENHGHKTWHIDHIQPCETFDLTDAGQQKKCFHYTNLQPLWVEDHLRKHGKEAQD